MAFGMGRLGGTGAEEGCGLRVWILASGVTRPSLRLCVGLPVTTRVATGFIMGRKSLEAEVVRRKMGELEGSAQAK